METILAGPWVGEFGWELFCWQGYLRHLSQNNKVIVVSKKESKFLYEDFSSSFFEFDPNGMELDSFKCHDMKSDFSALKEQIKFDKYVDPRDGVVFYCGKPHLCRNFYEQKFIKYGCMDGSKKYDILIHARSTKKCGTHFRNWPEEKWNNLVLELKGKNLSIASVGSPNGATYINGTDNLLGCDLKELASVMASSKVIVGPSSGPMHYASLCGLSQVVWSESKNRTKYFKTWNPFNVKVKFHDSDSWGANVKDVLKLVDEIMGEK